MSSKVAAFAATPDPTFGRQTPADANDAAPAPSEELGQAGDEGDMRLVIEEDQASGSYVYKTVNRRTGEVILQLPRAEILKLRDRAEYVAGTVIRTEA